MFGKNKKTRLICVGDWNKYHVWPPVGGLRHLIAHSKDNGFDEVVIRSGRRILIDEDAFFDWIESKREANKGD